MLGSSRDCHPSNEKEPMAVINSTFSCHFLLAGFTPINYVYTLTCTHGHRLMYIFPCTSTSQFLSFSLTRVSLSLYLTCVSVWQLTGITLAEGSLRGRRKRGLWGISQGSHPSTGTVYPWKYGVTGCPSHTSDTQVRYLLHLLWLQV